MLLAQCRLPRVTGCMQIAPPGQSGHHHGRLRQRPGNARPDQPEGAEQHERRAAAVGGRQGGRQHRSPFTHRGGTAVGGHHRSRGNREQRLVQGGLPLGAAGLVVAHRIGGGGTLLDAGARQLGTEAQEVGNRSGQFRGGRITGRHQDAVAFAHRGMDQAIHALGEAGLLLQAGQHRHFLVVAAWRLHRGQGTSASQRRHAGDDDLDAEGDREGGLTACAGARPCCVRACLHRLG
ncbi:hypothetical protein KSF81_16485 [Siccirubricoccus sp. G192]|nr:hypothetical protein [Siccirubricoccus sp. G192]